MGCSLGLATSIIHKKCSSQGGKVIGLDKSVEHLATAKKDFPAIEFQQIDVLNNRSKLKQLGEGFNKIFVDLNVNISFLALNVSTFVHSTNAKDKQMV